MSLPVVKIHYLRPPEREEVFRQQLVHEDVGVKVTFARSMALATPLEIDGRIALESGSDVVWFTFPGRWHDIGRFHTAEGVFTGLYANILTPPVFEPGHVWRTTDLFLDLWLPPDGTIRLLDRDEFEEAAAAGWIDGDARRRALEEVERVVAAVVAGSWPPPVVEAWTLERAREVAEGPQASDTSPSSSTR